MALISSTSLTQQQNFCDDCRNHLALYSTTKTPLDHNDSCDDCRKAFQKLTLQNVTQDHNMVNLGHHGYENANPFAEHDNDLTTATKGTESDYDYGEDDDWSFCTNHDEERMEIFMGSLSEVCREIYELGEAEANRLQTEEEEESEDEKSINLFQMEPSPLESIWIMPLAK